ncbi:hypothetical protein ABIC89_002401 [Variovorax boronicumulans]
MENCELCVLIEASPNKNWENDLDGDRVDRNTMAMRHTRWSCPKCRAPWRCIEVKATGVKSWSKT